MADSVDVKNTECADTLTNLIGDISDAFLFLSNNTTIFYDDIIEKQEFKKDGVKLLLGL